MTKPKKMTSFDAVVEVMMKSVKNLEVIVENLNDKVEALKANEIQFKEQIDMLILQLKSNQNDKEPDKLEANLDKNVKSSNNLKDDKMDTREEIEIDKFDCTKCEYSCRRKSELKKHMVDNHAMLCQAKCTKCDKTFPKNCEL